MKRKTELKLEEAKMYTRKYILSGRYIVRNTFVAVAALSVVGSAVLAVNIKKEVAETPKSISQMVAEDVETESGNFSINVAEASMIENESVDQLYTLFDDDDVLTAANTTNNLTESEYDMTGKFIVLTDGLNLRAEASTEGNILVVLNTGDTGEVIGTDGEWTLVSSEGSDGYLKSEFILTDDEATEMAELAANEGKTLRELLYKEETLVAEANIDEDEPEVIDLKKEEEKQNSQTAGNEQDEKKDDNKEAITTQVASTEVVTTETAKNDTTQAPKTEATTTQTVTTETVTTETATTEAPATEAPTTEAPTTEATTTEAPTTEATTEATTEYVEPETEAPTTEATTEYVEPETEEASYSNSSDLYLLAAIVYAEAGNQSYEGQLAVASVVMNRLYSGSFGGSLSEIIYAPSQFTAVYSTAFSTALSTGGSSTSLQAAQDALNGANNVPGLYYFRPTWNVDTSSLSYYVQIGDHIFY